MKHQNIMVGQSGGPTAAINASLAGVFSASMENPNQKIYGMHYGIEGLLNGDFFDLKQHFKTDRDLAILKQTPSSALGSCRRKLPDLAEGEEVYQNIFRILEEKEIGIFIYIGGNDSMDTILKLSEYGAKIQSEIRFIGVPKTIDNDLAGTDHTPGFGSAAKYVAASVKEVIRDNQVYDMESITVVEIMGRNAGWLTAAAALAKGEDCPGPDLIYLPERRFDRDAFVEKIHQLRKQKKDLVIAVSESLQNPDGSYLCANNLKNAASDSFGHKILSGTALILSDFISQELKIKSRGIVLNTLQRAAAHFASARDLEEAYTAGREAVKAAKGGHTGEMIVFQRVSDDPYRIQYQTADIKSIANAERVVSDSYITEDGCGVTDAFLQYARPLIQGSPELIFEGGLPVHTVL